MMRYAIGFWVVVVGVWVGGCAVRPVASGGEGVRPLAVAKGAGEPVEVEIKVAEVAADTAVIRWKITNHTAGKIWVPTHWGMSEDSMRELPMPFLAPPADVMLVFGDFTATAEGRQTIIEGRERMKSAAVAPGESLEKDVRVLLPFGRRDYHRLTLDSPFSFPAFLSEEKREVIEIQGLQAMVKYWTVEPGRWSFSNPISAMDPEYRLAAARVLMTGDKVDLFNSDPFARYAMSPRVEVHLPVAHGLEIYFTAKP